MTRLLTAIAVTILVMFGILVMAQADNGHHPQDMSAHEKFYSDWMRPDNPRLSCCNMKDCSWARGVRLLGTKWQALIGKEWVTIPPEKIEKNRDSPDGLPHICTIGFTIVCFIHGLGM